MPNPSFEAIDTCPNAYSQIYHALPWFQPCVYSGNTTNSSSSDLFNICSTPITVGIPNNLSGHQFARTGNGYAGIAMYEPFVNGSEYLEVKLISPLIQNRKYCVELYVSLANCN